MSKISEVELNRIAKNREKALALKNSRIHPYARKIGDEISENNTEASSGTGVQR